MENKRKIDEYIPRAINALNANQKIVKDGKISKAFSGQIATFAVAVSTGSLLSAVAFFSDSGGSKVERQELMNVIYEMIKNDDLCADIKKEENKSILLACVKDKYEKTYIEKKILEYRKFQQDILNAAIAIKLAMNFYDLVDSDAM